MFTWIADNIVTITICAVLVAIVAAIIVSLIRDKKKGKSTCGCNCAHCAMNGLPPVCGSPFFSKISEFAPLPIDKVGKACYTILTY